MMLATASNRSRPQPRACVIMARFGEMEYYPLSYTRLARLLTTASSPPYLGFVLTTTIASSVCPDSRQQQLLAWLTSLPRELGLKPDTLRPASSDASFRRYFRLDVDCDTATTRVVMDAPPAHEDCRPFVQVAELLAGAGLNVPRILAAELSQGFLLLSDLGPSTYYQRIQAGLAGADLEALYRQAIAALVRMQLVTASSLPRYDERLLRAELDLFFDWYAARHCQQPLADTERTSLAALFDTLAAHNAAQPSVFVHRDFHSPNLMLCDRPEYGENPGIIDFQSARSGPIGYDLASLVMDARTTWDEPQQLDWAIRYWEGARAAGLPVPADFADLHRDYEWLGLQRNVRILGVFARLHHRDGKPGYLTHMPRVSAYVRQVAQRYSVFTPLVRVLDRLENLSENRASAVGYTF